MMKKALILRDERSSEYFTNDYECWWSRRIEDAYKIKSIDEVDSLLDIRNSESIFGDVEFIEVVIVYTK